MTNVTVFREKFKYYSDYFYWYSREIKDTFASEFYSSSKDLGVKMDRHPQQIKRERQDKKKHIINTARTSDMKTAIKRVLETTDPQTAKELYINAVSTIDKMVSKGNLKKNTAARRKSQITRHLNSLST